MGNFLGKNNSNNKIYKNEFNELKKRLDDLEQVDKNKDGIISKEEFVQWKENQYIEIESFKVHLENEMNGKYQQILLDSERKLNELRDENKELNKRLEALKNINKILENKFRNQPINLENNLKNSITDETLNEIRKNELSELSKIKIEQFVSQLLADEDVNIKYLPDFVEEQIYKNVFTILISLMENIFKTADIQFMGHSLKFELEPIQNDETQTDSISTNNTHKNRHKKRKSKKK